MKIKNILNRPVIDGLLLVALMLFMFSVLWRSSHSPRAFSHRPGYVYDNYYMAINAKNISEGKGWGLSNGHEFIEFEREISTGPVVFMPVVLAMQWINDVDDARYLGVIFLNLFLMSLLLLRLRLFFQYPVYRFMWFILPFALLGFMRMQWYLVLGEVSASLLLLISASYVAEKNITFKHIIFSGLFSGMAVMSKLLAVMSVPWIVAVLFSSLIVQYGLFNGMRKLMPWFLGFCVVPGIVAVWYLVELQTGINELMDYTSDYLRYYLGLGWRESCPGLYYCLQLNFQSAADAWLSREGEWLAAISLLVPVVGLFLLFKKQKSSLDLLFIILSGMCLAQFLFFYFNGIHRFPRYYFIGGFISLFGLCLFAIDFLQQRIKHNLTRLCLFFVLLMVFVYGALPLYREKGLFPFHADTREVADYINHNDEIHEMLWSGFGYEPFPIASYYFNANKRWLSFYGFASANLTHSGEKLQVDADFYWKNYHNFYFLEQSEDTSASIGICATEKFRNHSYRILECKPSELEAFFISISQGKMRFPKPPTQVR